MKNRKIILIFGIILISLTFVSAWNITTSSYSVDSTHLGSSGSNISTSNYFARDTITYQQASDRNVVTAEYNANSGWFSVTAQEIGNVSIVDVLFLNESVFNSSRLFNESFVEYNMTLEYIVVNCSDHAGFVNNVTFELFNVEDNKSYINKTGYHFRYGLTDLYVLNASYPLRDSGNWSLNVTCEPSGGGIVDRNETAWELAWGSLVIGLIDPFMDTAVTIYEFFTFRSNVTCIGGECGLVNVTLDPEEIVCEDVTICENVSVGQECVNESVEICSEECSMQEVEICEDVTVEENQVECNEVCSSEEVCNGEGNKTICEEVETCEEVCEEVVVESIVENCSTIEEEVCVEVNCTESIVENCSDLFDQNCTVEEVCSFVKVNESEELDNETSGGSGGFGNYTQGNETQVGGESVMDNATEVVRVPFVLNSSVGEVSVEFAKNVSVVNSELVEIEVREGALGIMSVEDRNFSYLTPILAVELDEDVGANISLPKVLDSDLEVILKCDDWNFDGSVCDSGWHVYATVDELEQDIEGVWFSVDSFSAYVGGNLSDGETAFLSVWDENDFGMPGAVAGVESVRVSGDNVTFFADYKVAKNASKIDDGNCSIDINGSVREMVWDGGSYYNYTMNVSEAGLYGYVVSCNHSVYSNLSVGDEVSVGGNNTDSKGGAIPVNVTDGSVPFYTIDDNPQSCELKGGGSCELSWRVNATGVLDKIYDFFVEAFGYIVYGGSVRNTSDYTNSSHVYVQITANDTTNPVFVSTAVTPSAVINGSSVLINANIEDNIQVDSIWGVVTSPSGFNSSFGSVPFSFSNSSEVGRYNVTYYANDTSGNNETATTWFEVGESFNATINMDVNISVDFGGNSNFTFRLVHPEFGDTIFETRTNGSFDVEVPNIIYDILFIEAFDSTLNLTLRKVNLSLNEGRNISLDKHNQESGYFVTYGIDTGYEFNLSELVFVYNESGVGVEGNLRLDKCEDYNFSGRSCGSGGWGEVSSSPNTTGNYFDYSTLNFSGFSIMEYVAPTSDGGGGGSSSSGGSTYECVSGFERINGVCVQIIEDNQTNIPEQLFDITWNLEDRVVESVSELVGVVAFESFGTVPTPVDLTFIVIDSDGNEIYREKGEITVTTEEVMRWRFAEQGLASLSEGDYVAILETLYNVDVYDEFRQEFEIGNRKVGITCGVIDWFSEQGNLLIIWVLALFIVIFILFMVLKTVKRKKKRKLKSKIKVLNRSLGNNTKIVKEKRKKKRILKKKSKSTKSVRVVKRKKKRKVSVVNLTYSNLKKKLAMIRKDKKFIYKNIEKNKINKNFDKYFEEKHSNLPYELEKIKSEMKDSKLNEREVK